MNIVSFILIIVAVAAFLFEASGKATRPLITIGLALFASAWALQVIWHNDFIHIS